MENDIQQDQGHLEKRQLIFGGDEVKILLKNADTAMYRIKNKGGNGFEFFENPSEKSDKIIFSKPDEKSARKQNILIVDDDSDFQMLLQNCLKKEGYQCIGVDSVEKALENVHSHSPDLVILDLGLKKASGIAFLQNFVKSVASGEKVPPVLVVSGHSDPEIVEFSKMLGASVFIPKPLGATEILSAIRSFLN